MAPVLSGDFGSGFILAVKRVEQKCFRVIRLFENTSEQLRENSASNTNNLATLVKVK
jgi:hypothetical protein